MKLHNNGAQLKMHENCAAGIKDTAMRSFKMALDFWRENPWQQSVET